MGMIRNIREARAITAQQRADARAARSLQDALTVQVSACKSGAITRDQAVANIRALAAAVIREREAAGPPMGETLRTEASIALVRQFPHLAEPGSFWAAAGQQAETAP
jgi:hypothetical protein